MGPQGKYRSQEAHDKDTEVTRKNHIKESKGQQERLSKLQKPGSFESATLLLGTCICRDEAIYPLQHSLEQQKIKNKSPLSQGTLKQIMIQP